MATSKDKMRRTNKCTVLLNDSEAKALDQYCKRHPKVSRAQLIREAIFTQVFADIERSSTLFSEDEMQRMKDY